MAIFVEDKITLKLFLGIPLTADLKNSLLKSHTWKEAQIINQKELEETICDGKKFIGLYCDPEKTLTELHEIKNEILEKVNQYCPDFSCDKVKFQVFPQVFVG